VDAGLWRLADPKISLASLSSFFLSFFLSFSARLWRDGDLSIAWRRDGRRHLRAAPGRRPPFLMKTGVVPEVSDLMHLHQGRRADADI
jgi:hypothetical protein